MSHLLLLKEQVLSVSFCYCFLGGFFFNLLFFSKINKKWNSKNLVICCNLFSAFLRDCWSPVFSFFSVSYVQQFKDTDVNKSGHTTCRKRFIFETAINHFIQNWVNFFLIPGTFSFLRCEVNDLVCLDLCTVNTHHTRNYCWPVLHGSLLALFALEEN